MEKRLLLGTGIVLGAGVLLHRRRTYCRADLRTADVILIDSIAGWEQEEDRFLEETRRSGVLGFDCEWVVERNGKRNKVALLQLAPNERLCFLIRLSKLERAPAAVEEVLENPKVVKVGVSVLDDAKRLARDYGITCDSCLDLRHMALDYPRTRAMLKLGLSLQKLAHDFVGVALDKSIQLSCANWEADELAAREIAYAAEDALAAFLIAKKVASLQTNPVRVILNRSWMHATIMRGLQHLFDIPFTEKSFDIMNMSKHNAASKYAFSIKKRSKQCIRKSPFYDNCVLLAPDGEVLAAMKRRKADWYLDRGIAHLVSEEPYTVRLKFEPRGRAILDKVYYTITKDNQCVVCGGKEELVCKYVVPHEYRSFFPDVMTRHNSHDVLVLCLECHQRSNRADSKLRAELAEMCDAPLSEQKYVVNVETGQLVRAAKALARPTVAQIPVPRRIELENTVKRILQVDELTPELIESAASRDPRDPNENFVCHGLVVVEYFARERGILELESMWRKHFLESMKPAYLPALWSIDHHRRSLAYELGMWNYKNAEEVLKKIGMTREFVDNVTFEVNANNAVNKLLASTETLELDEDLTKSSNGSIIDDPVSS